MNTDASRRASAAHVGATTWWPKQRHADWRELPVCDAEWLVVWNVNLGGGKDAFSVHNGYWGDHPFIPDEVPAKRAYVWQADGAPLPDTWPRLGHFGGIISRIGLTARGVPTHAGIVLLPAATDADAFRSLIAVVDEEVAGADAAWCPALLGTREGTRPAVSVQRCGQDPTPARRAAERAGVDDIVVVDIFGDRTHWTAGDPCSLVRGNLDGSGRQARPGHEGLADVPVPEIFR